MTLKEYEQIIGQRLINACTAKNRAQLQGMFEEADSVLEHNQISSAQQKEFWGEVRQIIYARRLLLEKQSNSALLVLMQMLEKEIAARTSAGAGKSK
jgi:tRNA C32,U32 (ribose-2'-O)-methylase TrmJ